MRIVHTADLHVGMTDALGVTKAGLRATVRATHDLDADLLLIAGDLFDTDRVADEFVELVLNELARVVCRTVVLPGNHDSLRGSSIHRRVELESFLPHVTVIRDEAGQCVQYADLGVTVWGRPITEHSPAMRPLEGLPRAQPGQINIVMAHGLVIQQPSDRGRSSPIELDELRSSGWHYVALGHRHDFRVWELGGSIACYSGSPAGACFLPPIGQVAAVEIGADGRVRVGPYRAEF